MLPIAARFTTEEKGIDKAAWAVIFSADFCTPVSIFNEIQG